MRVGGELLRRLGGYLGFRSFVPSGTRQVGVDGPPDADGKYDANKVSAQGHKDSGHRHEHPSLCTAH